MGIRSRSLELLVFTVGAGALGAEIAAARLMAPWFGASTIVWANTIAIVLVSLSVGYALGGRLADKDPRPAGLARIVLAASVLLAIVPFVSGPFLRLAARAVDQLSAAIFVGSLVGVGVLIAIPLLLLGMVSPYALRLSVDTLDATGRTAGRLYAISTLGSLVGTFLAALLLIPFVGTRRTFLIFAGAMALAACHSWRAGGSGCRRTRGDPGPRGPADGHDQVRRHRRRPGDLGGGDGLPVRAGPPGARRRAHPGADEGYAVHSEYRPGRWLTGNYWDEMLALSLAGGHSPPRSVAILGDAAGTSARQLGHYFPGTRIDAVELDGELTKVGRALFDLHGPNLHTHTADARPWLYATPRRFDVIMVDAYRQPYIPFYLTTQEFFALVRDRLEPGGLVIVNVAQPPGSTSLEKVLSATMRAAFGYGAVWRDPSEEVNTMLVGSTAGDPARRLRGASGTLPPDLAPLVSAASARVAPALTGGQVFTDDRAPVEWLIDLSLADQVG